MPSIELNKLQAVTGVRALSDTERSAAGALGKTRVDQASGNSGAAGAVSGGISLEIGSTAGAAGIASSSPPIDTDRVSQIRDALKEGSYPLIPAKIADAIIAAQFSFEVQR